MEATIKITRELINKGMSSRGGWSNAQLRVLGISSCHNHGGWKKRLIGTYITEGQVEEFFALRNAHVRKKMKEERMNKKQRGKNNNPMSIYNKDDWVDIRERVLMRDNKRCVNCGSLKNPQVHHLLYERGKEIWAIPIWYLVTLCEGCHKIEHLKNLISPSQIFEFKKKVN